MTKKQIPSKTKAVPIPTDTNALKKLKISLGVIIAAFAFLLYAPSISFNYILDDEYVIKNNKVVQEGISSIPTILSTDYFSGYKRLNLNGPVYRPVPLILYAIEWNLFPDSPHIFHFINVLLYAFTCWVLFLLLCNLFKKQNLLFPFVCSLLYAVHPIHTEVVNYIKSVDEILCFLFGILSIYYFIKSSSDKSFLNIILGCVYFFLAMLSKETGITFLIIIPLTIFIFSDVPRRKMVVIIIMLLIISAIYIIIRSYVLYSIRIDTSDTDLYNSVVASPNIISREATVFFILLKYLQLLLFPLNLTCDYNFAMIKIQTFSDFPAILGILINLGIGIYSVINLKRKSIISYGILFYFITLSPVSNMFINNGPTMAERFMYMPSLGFCIILTYLLFKLTKTEAVKKQVQNLLQIFSLNKKLFIFLFIITGLYSIRTFSRSMDWKDDYTIFKHDVEVSGNSATAHYCWGNILANDMYLAEKDSFQKMKYLDSAIIEYNKAIAIFHYYNIAYSRLAQAYLYKKDFQNAIRVYETLLQSNKGERIGDQHYLAKIFYDFGVSLKQEKQYDNALNAFDSALKYDPNSFGAHNNKGALLVELKKYQDGIFELQKAIEVDPKSAVTYKNLGSAYANLGEYSKALEFYNKAIEINPNLIEVYKFMSTIYQITGDNQKSKEYLEKAKMMSVGQQR